MTVRYALIQLDRPMDLPGFAAGTTAVMDVEGEPGPWGVRLGGVVVPWGHILFTSEWAAVAQWEWLTVQRGYGKGQSEHVTLVPADPAMGVGQQNATNPLPAKALYKGQMVSQAQYAAALREAAKAARKKR